MIESTNSTAKMTQLQKLHKRVFVGPSDASMMEALEWEPAQTTKIQFCETLLANLTDLQARLLVQTCGYYAENYEWLPKERLRAGEKRSAQAELARYALNDRNGTLSATDSGRMLFEYIAEDPSSFVEAFRALNRDPEAWGPTLQFFEDSTSPDS